MKTKFTLLALLFNLLAFAQDGTLDTTFGTNGKVDYSQFTSDFIDMQFDYNNKKIVAIGQKYDIPTASYTAFIARFNLNGSIDTSFSGDGILEINNAFDDSPASLYIDNDVSTSYFVASTFKGNVTKIKDNGAFDTTFGTNGVFTYNNFNYFNYRNVPMTYHNNFLYIASNDIQISSTNIKLYKINQYGIPDPTFLSGNPGSYTISNGDNAEPTSLSIKDNGEIFMSYTRLVNGTYKNFLSRISNTTGTIEQFNLQSANFKSYPGFVLDTSNNDSYAFGMSETNKFLLTKNNATYNFDTSFGTNGSCSVDFPNFNFANAKSITGHEFGNTFKIILAGRTAVTNNTTGTTNISLVRLLDNGIIDNSFGTNGKTSVPIMLNDSNLSFALKSVIDETNGKLYVMGYSNYGLSPSSKVVSLYRFNLSSILSNDEFAKPQLTIAPNPTHSQITFSQQINNLDVFDLLGKKVKTFDQTNTSFDVSGLQKGLYLLQGKTTDGNLFNEKLIKN